MSKKIYLDCSTYGLHLYFSNPNYNLSSSTLEMVMEGIEIHKWPEYDKHRNNYYAFIMRGKEVLHVYDGEIHSKTHIFLKDNKPFTIPGLEFKYKFLFSGVKEHPYCGDVIETEDFTEMHGLIGRQASIIQAEEKEKGVFDWRPRRIDYFGDY